MAKFDDLRKTIFQDRGSISEEIVTLPSGKKATLRPMKVKEQKSILKAIEKRDTTLINQAFDELLDKTVLTVDGEPYDNDNILIQDRIYLLIKVRQLTTGNIAKISHLNPLTKKVVNNVEVDLTKLEVDPLKADLETVKQISKSIYITLEATTRKHEKEIEKWLKKNKSEDSMTDRRYAAYASCIKNIYTIDESNARTVYDNLSFDEKIQFVMECKQDDLKLFDDFLSTLDFGIKLKFHFKDEEYENEEEEVNIINFFIM